MEKYRLIRNFKIIIVISFIIGLIGALIYLGYGFMIIWQGMAAGIIIGFLTIIVLILLVISIYLWLKSLWIKREYNILLKQLKNCQNDLKHEKAKKAEEIEISVKK
ncbi:MAG: hypothetical protein QME14_07665 [Methanobacteriaceae archaeon]|nr:hypothetical protein [Methanobacteriaceae archaeon]